MQAEEEFRSRLRDDLAHRSAPPVGALVPEALGTGRRMRRRRRTLTAVSGTAVLAAVAVGSATLFGAFGTDTASSAGIGPDGEPKPAASSPGLGAPTPHTPPPPSQASSPSSPAGDTQTPSSTWTVPPPATLTDPAWVTPQAIVAEIKKLLPANASTSQYAGNYVNGGGDPRAMWTVDGQLSIATSKGPKEVDVTLHQTTGAAWGGCAGVKMCVTVILLDGTRIAMQRGWTSPDGTTKGLSYWLQRTNGMLVRVSVHDESLWTDDQLFALASSPAFSSMKMEKSFVDQADATIKGTFMNPPAGG